MSAEVASCVPAIPNGSAGDDEQIGGDPTTIPDQQSAAELLPVAAIKEVPGSPKTSDSLSQTSEESSSSQETKSSPSKSEDNATAMEEGTTEAVEAESEGGMEEDESTADKSQEDEEKEEDHTLPDAAEEEKREQETSVDSKIPQSKRSSKKKSPKKSSPKPAAEELEQKEGKRRRSTVQRFSADDYTVSKEFVVPEGPGTRLGDIPYVEAMISKAAVDDLKKLHSLAFGRIGTAKDVRSNLRKFSGFAFDKDSAKFKDARKKMDKGWVVKQMNAACDIFGIPRGKGKEELMDVVLQFMLSPSDTGKSIPQKRGTKRKSKGIKGSGKQKGGRGRKKADESSGSEKDEEGEDESEEDEPEEEKVEAPPPPKKPKSSPAPAKGGGKKMPTNNELTKVIRDLLKGVNLEQVTMKEMCRKVNAKFPDQDMSSKKDFIKATVKEIISAND